MLCNEIIRGAAASAPAEQHVCLPGMKSEKLQQIMCTATPALLSGEASIAAVQNGKLGSPLCLLAVGYRESFCYSGPQREQRELVAPAVDVLLKPGACPSFQFVGVPEELRADATDKQICKSASPQQSQTGWERDNLRPQSSSVMQTPKANRGTHSSSEP